MIERNRSPVHRFVRRSDHFRQNDFCPDRLERFCNPVHLKMGNKMTDLNLVSELSLHIIQPSSYLGFVYIKN